MRVAVAGLSVLLSCAVTATADAATLVNSGGTLTFTGTTGRDIVFFDGGPSVLVNRFTATDAALDSVSGCTDNGSLPGQERYRCDGVSTIVVDAGDGNDWVTARAVLPQAVSGGAGDDDLYGTGTATTLSGDRGDDDFDGGRGATFSGGPGVDLAYADTGVHTLPVAYSLDGVANDGEGANFLPDVENITTREPGGPPDEAPKTNGPVTLTGSDAANRLTGGNSADVITGGAGADTLIARAGDDLINARDGVRDSVSCGGGTDTVIADAEDEDDGTCETVERPPAGPRPEDKAPSLAWKLPATAARLPAARATTLEVTASDDHGVRSVRFLDDGRELCTVTSSPFTCAFQPRPEDVGPNTLVAVVTDAAGQTATVTRALTVAKFTPKRVSLRVAKRGGRYVATGKVTLPKGPRCEGVVSVRATPGRTRFAKLSKACTYRVTLPSGSRRPRFVATYEGTKVVAAKRSPAR